MIYQTKSIHNRYYTKTQAHIQHIYDNNKTTYKRCSTKPIAQHIYNAINTTTWAQHICNTIYTI